MGPRRAKVPALEPLAAPQNDEERKERQRLHVKRTYYKKLNEMQNQRDRVRQLEEEYARLVAQKKARTKTDSGVPVLYAKPNSPDADFLTDADVTADADFLTDADVTADAHFIFDADLFHDQLFDTTVGAVGVGPSDHGSGDHANNSGRLDLVKTGGLQSMQNLYTEISEIKEKLLAENEAMRNSIAEHQRFSQKLAAWMETDEGFAPDDEGPTYRRARLVKSVTTTFCQAFARTAFEDMWQYRQSKGFVSSGVSVFGWRDRRLPVGDRVRFSLKKLFQKRTALDLALRGWGVLSMPKSLESMFSPSANATFSTVQVIDDDNKILFRLMVSPDGMVLAKTLFMVTRFAIPNGFVVCIKSIDPNLTVPSELPPGMIEKWVEHSTWVTFESAGDDNEHCEIEFSGELQISPLVPQEMWLLEILFIILRFEGKITGPLGAAKLKPIDAKLTPAEKRERQRLHVKRTYYRKLNLIQGLREDVRRLEEEYDRRLVSRAKQGGTTPKPELELIQSDEAIRVSTSLRNHASTRLAVQYDELCQIKQQLRAQNEALQIAIKEHAEVAQRLQRVLMQEQSRASTIQEASGKSRPPMLSTPNNISSSSTCPVSLRFQIDVKSCQEIARTTFADMQRFRESHGLVTTGVSVFGWHDKRRIRGDRFQFSMKKMFLNITPFELSLRGWSVVTSNPLLSSLYSSAYNVRMYTLQRVDDDNEIRFRVMTSADGRVRVKTLFLVSRFESSLGYTFIIRSLDHTHWLAPYDDPPGVQEKWTDYYNWTIFEGSGEHNQHSKIEFGGETQRNAVLGPDVWMLEILSFMLRWESIVIGPIFSLCL